MADDPRISVNKLGEYLTTSSPVRRRSIIRQQKRPSPGIAQRYRQATEPIQNFLATEGVDVEAMAKAIDSLRDGTPTSEWTADDNKNTADALERFLEVADALPTDSVTYVRGPSDPPKLVVAGVAISVRPDFLLHFNRGSREGIGALKIHYIKDDGKSLKQSGQEYVATLCRQWLAEYGHGGREVIHTRYFSLDLFRSSLVHAPAAYTKRMRKSKLRALISQQFGRPFHS
jgi:hypothetical protein